MDSYRSILLADCIGKVSARAYRMMHLDIFGALLSTDLSVQCGGTPGLGTEFPALVTRILQDYAKKNDLSISLIFVDAKQAFYAVLRSLVVDLQESDYAVAYLLKSLNIPPEAMQELATKLEQASVFEQEGLPGPLHRDIASTYTATHFSVRNADKIGLALAGTRPGHPYADIVFFICFPESLRRHCRQAR